MPVTTSISNDVREVDALGSLALLRIHRADHLERGAADPLSAGARPRAARLGERDACEHERSHAERTVKLLRKTLRRVLLR
jgi:hypothetical protein